MAKRLISLAIFSLFFFVFLSTPSKSFAFLDAWRSTNNPFEEYCKLRSGNQMNLETWYSGKCTGTFQERLGFADMVFLDFFGDFNPGSDSSGGSSLIPFGDFLAKMVSTKPVSTSLYRDEVNQNLAKHNIVQSAYAQASPGYGFRSLGPVIVIWKIFRDIVYLLFIIAFVVYGFMIMFRMKISAQAVVSIQTAIPNLIVVLLLITFSYPIAGLVVDLVYVLQEVILNAMFAKINSTFSVQGQLFGWGASMGVSNNGVNIGTPLGNIRLDNPFINGLVSTAFGTLGRDLSTGADNFASLVIARYGGIGLPLVYLLLAITLGQIPQKVISILVPQTGYNFADGFFNKAAASVVNNPIFVIIVWLVLFIAIFYTFFKIVYALIQAFVMLIFNVIFSPFIILRGILPGNDAFGDWLRSIVAYLVAFPATTFCFLLSFIFIGSVRFGGTTDDVLPPLINLFVPTSGLKVSLNLFDIGNTTGAVLVPPPLGIGGLIGPGAEPLLALIGLGIFFMTPKIVEMVQEALKVPAFKYGAAIGEALNYGYGPIGKLLVDPATGFVKDTAQGHVYDRVADAATGSGNLGVKNPLAMQAKRVLEKRGWGKDITTK